MEGTIHTLQDYMLHTESITYILVVGALVGITFFYRFLTERDDDEKWPLKGQFGLRLVAARSYASERSGPGGIADLAKRMFEVIEWKKVSIVNLVE